MFGGLCDGEALGNLAHAGWIGPQIGRVVSKYQFLAFI